MKPIVRRAKADDDIQQAIDYFVVNASDYALPFIDAVEEAYRHIQKHPDTGSPHYAHELDLPGLRFWVCNRFPYLVFYVEQASKIEVWRVLHSHQDIPETLQEE